MDSPEEDMNTIEVGKTSSDWEPTETTRFYAQRGSLYTFGATEREAFEALLRTEEELQK